MHLLERPALVLRAYDQWGLVAHPDGFAAFLQARFGKVIQSERHKHVAEVIVYCVTGSSFKV